MTHKPLVELQGISFTFPGQKGKILDNFHFSIHENEKSGLIGPNGCGKTTLFHVIMGLKKPCAGRILLNGKEVKTKKALWELRKNVGLLFQDADDQLFSPTVIEDVAFGPLNLGFTPGDAKKRALQTLDDLGLYGFADRITHQLSGGEKKLVSLATILAMEPKVLLLDEPTNNLDPATRDRLMEILQELRVSFYIISHDLDFLGATCNDIYAMQKGQTNRCDKAHIHNHSHAHAHGEQPHKHGH